MADARLVEIAVTVETDPATTHFQIRFSANGSTWTTYDPGDDDIAVASLEDGVYLLDGVNSPAGNAAAASEEGNWYAVRLKSAGGYGNWSDRFRGVAIGDAYGPIADVGDVFEEFDIAANSLGAADSGWDFADNAEAERVVGRLLADAMTELRADSSVDSYYTTATTPAAKRRALGMAERWLAVSRALLKPATMKALGTHNPLLMESSDAILDLADRLEVKAYALVDRTMAGNGTRRYAMPAVLSSTFTPLSTDRTPVERLLLLDERDGISASDLDNG